MIKHAIRLVFIISASMLLYGCGEKLELRVNARMDGKPAAEAKILVDGKEEGVADANGAFTKIIRKKPGADVEVTVARELPGYSIKPWKSTFLMKLPKSGSIDTYSLNAELSALRYITIVATDQGSPVAEAVVKAGGKEAGKTDAQGEFVYHYKDSPKGGLELTVVKQGYAPWRKTADVEPGQRLAAALSKQVSIVVAALTEEYGQTNGIAGVSVRLDNKQIGRTDAKGALIYRYDGEPGRKAQITLEAPGHVPAVWKTSVVLEGEAAVQHYFYPATAKPIRAGIYRFVSNAPKADMKEVLGKVESSVAAQLFKNPCFREVSTKTLQAEIKHAKLSIEIIIVKGWRETPLFRTVDMIILGSVAKDDKGLLIETKFYAAGGRLILSQITRAPGEGDITRAAKEIASSVLERFPFEGTVIGSEEERYRVNIGRSYKISRGAELVLMAPRRDESGKISGYRESGRLKVKKSEDSGAWTEVEDLKKGEKISLGDRVVRRLSLEDDATARNYFILSAKGGLAPDLSPLSGVNIYVNDEWRGSTAADGKAEVPVRIGKNFNLVLYRHGYQQVIQNVKIDKNKDAKEFVLCRQQCIV